MASQLVPTELRYAAPLFAALGDRTRMRLLVQLAAGGPASIARLSAQSALTRQSITKHLRVLEQAGLARSQRQGRELRWELEARRLLEAKEYLDLVAQHWDAALARLRAFVDD